MMMLVVLLAVSVMAQDHGLDLSIIFNGGVSDKDIADGKATAVDINDPNRRVPKASSTPAPRNKTIDIKPVLPEDNVESIDEKVDFIEDKEDSIEEDMATQNSAKEQEKGSLLWILLAIAGVVVIVLAASMGYVIHTRKQEKEVQEIINQHNQELLI